MQFHQVGYQIECNDKIAFINFRQVNLDIHVTSQYIEYNDKAVGSIGRFLTDLIDMLGLAFDSRYGRSNRSWRSRS